MGLSFEQPVETLESISIGTLNLIEGIRILGLPSHYYNAGSSECYGDTGGAPADEETPFRPRSPYAVAKAAAFWEVANYREAYGAFACSGILFNHESPLRPERFVTQKIVAAACRIAAGAMEKWRSATSKSRAMGLGAGILRAMWKMLQQPDRALRDRDRQTSPLRTSWSSRSVKWASMAASRRSGLALTRPSDIGVSRANPARPPVISIGPPR